MTYTRDMNNPTTPTTAHNVRVLLGNPVTLPDGRRGIVDAIDGTTLTVETNRTDRPATVRSYDDLFEIVQVQAHLVTHRA